MYYEGVLFCGVSGFGSVEEWVFDDFGYFSGFAGVWGGELDFTGERDIWTNGKNKIDWKFKARTDQTNSGGDNCQKSLAKTRRDEIAVEVIQQGTSISQHI